MQIRRDQKPRFLELEQDAAAIKAFVTTENARTKARLCDDAFARDVEIARKILENPETLDRVTRRGQWLYWFRQTADNPRGQWLRLNEASSVAPDADWQLVFDLDAYCAETGEIWHWGWVETAWFDPSRVMLSLSLGGSDQVRFVEFDCDSASFVQGGFDLPPSRSKIAWLDADSLLWGVAEEEISTSSDWPGQIRRLTRGGDPKGAPVLFEADHEDLLVQPYVVIDADRRAMSCVSRYTHINHEQVVFLDGPYAGQTLPTPADTMGWHNATHYAYVVQSEGGQPGTLMLGKIGDANERCVFTPSARRVVDRYSICLLQDWLLWTVSDNLKHSIHVLDLRDQMAEPRQLVLPVDAENLHVRFHDATGHAGDGKTLQLGVSGFLQPPATYLFDLTNGIDAIEWRLLRQAPASFDSSSMQVEMLEATSDDGTSVPYRLVRPKGAEPDGDLPVLMYAYGGFGASVGPWYSRLNGALWLERGCAYALCHIRGGSEFGPEWHLQAKREGRNLCFQDFAAIASDLVERGLSRPDRIACHGASNGGLLCGVMLTRYPERFGAIWASVGVHDMARFHLFPAGMAWRDEYGDPEDPDDLKMMLGYSPIDNIPSDAVTMPEALIDTSSRDDRVDPSHSRRFAKALLEAGHTPLFIEHGDGGHGWGGATGAQALKQATGYAFLRHALGIASNG